MVLMSVSGKDFNKWLLPSLLNGDRWVQVRRRQGGISEADGPPSSVHQSAVRLLESLRILIPW